ncbi:MAG TPA: DUF2993 domain-containing protein [Kribbellaceae bacterium]|nr:DUF2993 domain-containing protein [Kribbellaceae bacterium]
MSSRRPGRWLRSLTIAAVLLACLAFIADRVAESIAEDRLAAAAEEEAARYDVRASETSVEIGGVGFLPQLVSGEFSDITLRMQQPTISKVPAQDLTVEMTEIQVPRELLTGDTSAPVSAASADLRLRLSPDAMTKLAARTSGVDGLKLRIVGGKLHARVSVEGVDASATVRPQTENGRIKATVDDLPAGVPSEIREEVNALLSKGIQIPELPFGAKLTQIAVEGQSLVLTATAADVELA